MAFAIRRLNHDTTNRRTDMARKPRTPQQWMLDHPDDVPCPPRGGAIHWRRACGLDEWQKKRTAAQDAQQQKYEAAMVEKRRNTKN
jgi:hypothetical protein